MKSSAVSIKGLSLGIVLLIAALILGYLYVNLFVFPGKLIFSVHAAIILFLCAAIFLEDFKGFVLFALVCTIPMGLSYHLVRHYFWAQHFQPMEFGITIDLAVILVAVLYAHWMFSISFTREWKRPTLGHPVGTLFLIWILYTTVAGLYKSVDFQYTLYEIVALIKGFLIYFYLANNVTTERDLKIVTYGLISGMTALGLYMVIQFATGLNYSVIGEFFPPKADAVGFRAAGFTGADVQHAQMLSFVLPVALAYYFSLSKSAPRVLMFVAQLLMIGGIMASKSRAAGFAALMGCLTVIGFGGLRKWIPRWRILKATIFVILFLIAVSPLIYMRFQLGEGGYEEARAPLMSTALAMFSDHWALGVGASNYGLNVDTYIPVRMRAAWKANIHNEYLLHLAERGIIGALIYYWMTLAVLIKLWKASRSPDPWIELVAVGLVGAMLGSLVIRFFHWFHEMPFFEYYSIILGLTIALEGLERRRVEDSQVSAGGPRNGTLAERTRQKEPSIIKA